jgi:uncharacterized protein YjbJ (UPF0337 family)
MSTEKKRRNAAQHAAGRAKELRGKIKGDPDLEAEGQVDQAHADIKQAAEKVKDALRH